MIRISRRELLAVAGTGLAAGLVAAPRAEGEGRKPVDDGMILIPAGPFRMGTRPDEAERLARRYGYHVSWLSGEVPQRTIELPAYRIDRYPVTNRQFAAFCEATGYAPRPHWGGRKPPDALLDHPVVFVNRADALAYATWAGKRLPTEAEWEKAARGVEGRLFPWGSEFDPDACRWNRPHDGPGPRTSPVTAHPKGAGPYGVMDLCGNAAEWCADSPGPGSGYVKGGCWHTTQPLNLRPASRTMSGFDNNALPYIGFRCAKEAE